MDDNKIMIITTQPPSPESQHPKTRIRGVPGALKGNRTQFLLHPTPSSVSQNSDLACCPWSWHFLLIPICFPSACLWFPLENIRLCVRGL